MELEANVHQKREKRGNFTGGPMTRLWAPSVGSPGSIPGQGTRSHILQLRVGMLQGRLKISLAATKTQCNQINKYSLKKKKKERKKPYGLIKKERKKREGREADGEET